MKICNKCGESDFFPRGGCRPCKKRTTLERAQRPCNVCGETDYMPSGQCRPCQKRTMLARTKQPCNVCGETDYTPSGACKTCFNARSAFRRARKRQATPPWLTPEHKKKIESHYVRARRKTAETGILYHVDHIVPLISEHVCGLHVPWNLRAIPASINLSKKNRHDEDFVNQLPVRNTQLISDNS